MFCNYNILRSFCFTCNCRRVLQIMLKFFTFVYLIYYSCYDCAVVQRLLHDFHRLIDKIEIYPGEIRNTING
jgi:hypothetical protein